MLLRPMETQTGRTSSDSGNAAPSLTDIQLCNAGRPAVIARPLTRAKLIAILVTMVVTSTPASINPPANVELFRKGS